MKQSIKLKESRVKLISEHEEEESWIMNLHSERLKFLSHKTPTLAPSAAIIFDSIIQLALSSQQSLKNHSPP